MFKAIGKIITRYLNSSEGWEHSHIQDGGVFAGQWREDSWRNKSNGWGVVHFQNFKHPGASSAASSPRHTWRIHNGKHKEIWGLTFTYGIVTFRDETRYQRGE